MKRTACVVFAIAVLLGCRGLFAQEENGQIDVQVTDLSGAVVPHAQVRLRPQAKGGTHAGPRWVTGTYRNPALGYSVSVPRGLKAVTGDQAGPERGLGISLRSGGVIAAWGEPNSLEWKSPAEGLRWALSNEKCPSGRQELSAARVGSIKGAKGRMVCGDRVIVLLLAFRPGGGPIYWLRLDTTSVHAVDDEATLSNFAATFRLIPWQ